MKSKRFSETDHCGSEESGRRGENEGAVPAKRDLRSDVLQLEGEVRGDDGVGGEGGRVNDTPAEREDSSIWVKLRRRRVVQWGLVYVAGSCSQRLALAAAS